MSGGGYGSVTAADVAVTVADDETASTVTLGDGRLTEDAGDAITVTNDIGHGDGVGVGREPRPRTSRRFRTVSGGEFYTDGSIDENDELTSPPEQGLSVTGT